MVFYWFIVEVIALVVVQVHGQSTEGFISIDCGVESNWSYADPVTKIPYVPDDQFIDAGSKYSIDAAYVTSKLPKQLLYLRSFPDGARNCYKLQVTHSHKYLVRATFMYGNYDGKNKADASSLLWFDLHLGVNFWKRINITDASDVYTAEVLTVAALDNVSVCLVNTGNGSPFISALELRPLKDTMYQFVDLSQSIVLLSRRNLGSLTGDIVRYPDDPYDRIWKPMNVPSYTWATLSTDKEVNSSGDGFEAPSAVLRTASTPVNGLSLQMSFESSSVHDQFYDVLYFTELEVLTGDMTRILSISRNEDVVVSRFKPPYLKSGCISAAKPFSGQTQYYYTIGTTSDSTLTPFLNAMEFYSVMALNEVATELRDVNAINAIKVQYQVKKNWFGDPCNPKEYVWDGLSCRHAPNFSTITSVNLSASGLTGAISSSFAELIALEYLDLSNNSLTGKIPDTLGNLTSLQFLDLSCNNLTGQIPASILKRSQAGQLRIRYDNGSSHCANSVLVLSSPSAVATTESGTSPSDETNTKKRRIRNIIISVFSALGGTTILPYIALAMWKAYWKSKKKQENPKPGTDHENTGTGSGGASSVQHQGGISCCTVNCWKSHANSN